MSLSVIFYSFVFALVILFHLSTSIHVKFKCLVCINSWLIEVNMIYAIGYPPIPTTQAIEWLVDLLLADIVW
jgi:hypothetical protein